MRLTNKYDGQNDPRTHLAKWTQAYGEKPQPEWVHLFCHTLDDIPMNWYIETELLHGTGEWDILREGFMMTFSFQEEFDSIDEVLQEVKAAIFRIPQDPFDLIHPEWATQLSRTLECYNVTAEVEDEGPWKINILEIEGRREIQGPQIENPNIIVPLKTKQVNIGTEAEPKFTKIGDYQDDAIVDKVAELLREYQDLFPTKFIDLKGIIGDLGMMKITFKPDAKPVQQRPHRLNPKYKEKVCLELDKMLAVGLIEAMEESDWLSPMVV